MIGSRANFVLVTGGHLQAILRPPGGRSAGYRTAPFTPADPDEWLRRSKLHDASWWDHWLGLGRAPLVRPPPGARARPAATSSRCLEAAPGQYVARRL